MNGSHELHKIDTSDYKKICYANLLLLMACKKWADSRELVCDVILAGDAHALKQFLAEAYTWNS